MVIIKEILVKVAPISAANKHITSDTHVSNCIRFVSTMGSAVLPLGCATTALAAFSSPFSFILVSDLWEPEEEDGRSSSGFGCINVKGSSATSSLQYKNKLVLKRSLPFETQYD